MHFHRFKIVRQLINRYFVFFEDPPIFDDVLVHFFVLDEPNQVPGPSGALALSAPLDIFSILKVQLINRVDLGKSLLDGLALFYVTLAVRTRLLALRFFFVVFKLVLRIVYG